eukprot:TRINITY_DN4640_c0_g1_i1.p1 TRINITY_DN4640_c0_g1~~TRINITY_DN4640_c0_g1_i1.p1  ORF type:complete len:804 (+),score=208.63 TRINITY_DN4640_c0_g1_i1:148-2559(+)
MHRQSHQTLHENNNARVGVICEDEEGSRSSNNIDDTVGLIDESKWNINRSLIGNSSPKIVRARSNFVESSSNRSSRKNSFKGPRFRSEDLTGLSPRRASGGELDGSFHNEDSAKFFIPPALAAAEDKRLASLPSEDFPELTRGMVRRAKVWVARSRLNLALKKAGVGRYGSGEYSISSITQFRKKHLAPHHFPFGVAKTSKNEDFMVELVNPTGDSSLFVVPPSRSSSVQSDFGEPPQSSFAKFWDALGTNLLKYSFCLTGAMLFGALAGLFLLGNVYLDKVSMGLVFLIFAGAFVLYIPAGIAEDLFFLFLEGVVRVMPFMRNMQFLAGTLKVKIRFIVVGMGLLFAFEHVDGLYDAGESQKVVNIFAVGSGCWIVFDIMLESVMHRWNVHSHLQRLNEITYAEAIVRHLLKPLIPPEESLIDFKTWRTVQFKPLRIRSSFYKYDQRLAYLRDSTFLVPLRRTHVAAPRSNFLSYSYSNQTFLSISNASEARVIAQVLFYRLDGGTQGIVTFSSWLRHFGKFKNAAKAWSVFFGQLRQNLKGIDEQTFVDTFVALFQRRADLSSTLGDFQNISNVVKTIITVVFWIVMIVFLSLAAGVSASKVFATFATILVSGAVAFGNSLKTVVDALVFILQTKPYDVGDRVALKDPLAPPLTVQRIQVMSTTFVGLDNRVVIITNSQLANIPIYNLRRSKNAVVEIVFEIGFRTPQSKLKILKEAVSQYLDGHRFTKSRFEFYLKEVDKLNSVFLHIWFQTAYAWQEGFPINYVRSDVVAFIQEQMDELGIEWNNPTIPVRVTEKQVIV